ncbi:hypothetical protein ANHYDRO_01862 [Anaerococcus hydrogenalis DSM 7454]|uniref:Uncharacterized protein n=1 Tax=Anaerococcus hydrogenalis DSM 7454 TaxID=561177 RepID=B6WB81_9FIRM|nr:hypothetical protein ANHYDRO_01862 [Anaerococcus hydrogenalis DSM 7454]
MNIQKILIEKFKYKQNIKKDLSTRLEMGGCNIRIIAKGFF